MPELPEVETTRRGIAPYLIGRRIIGVEVRNPRLRWPIAPDLEATLCGQRIHAVTRRAKYLLLAADTGQLLLHLGMSGSLRISPPEQAYKKHDHVQWCLEEGIAMRLHDPRRFGCVLWLSGEHSATHPLLAGLGPEPLEDAFDAAYLYQYTRSRTMPIKVLIMNARCVVGVGNIYASESLFMAGIRPGTAATRLSKAQCARLVTAIKTVLQAAIAQGGTTLRDFVREDGQHGYFRQQLQVYQRDGQPCHLCHSLIKKTVHGQRASYYCPVCQA